MDMTGSVENLTPADSAVSSDSSSDEGGVEESSNNLVEQEHDEESGGQDQTIPAGSDDIEVNEDNDNATGADQGAKPVYIGVQKEDGSYQMFLKSDFDELLAAGKIQVTEESQKKYVLLSSSSSPPNDDMETGAAPIPVFDTNSSDEDSLGFKVEDTATCETHSLNKDTDSLSKGQDESESQSTKEASSQAKSEESDFSILSWRTLFCSSFSQRDKWIGIFGAVLVFLILIIGLSLGPPKANDDDSTPPSSMGDPSLNENAFVPSSPMSSNDSVTVTSSPKASPNSVPSPGTTRSPTGSPVASAPTAIPSNMPTSIKEAELIAVLSEYFEVDFPSSTVQKEALYQLSQRDFWETDEDEFNYSNKWLERYILTIFFISTKGSNWSVAASWNSPFSGICDWYGISCDDDDQVEEIELGK